MGLALDELDNRFNNVVNSDGIQVVFDPDLWPYIRYSSEFTIDYTNSAYGPGFVIDTGRSRRSSRMQC